MRQAVPDCHPRRRPVPPGYRMAHRRTLQWPVRQESAKTRIAATNRLAIRLRAYFARPRKPQTRPRLRVVAASLVPSGNRADDHPQPSRRHPLGLRQDVLVLYPIASLCVIPASCASLLLEMWLCASQPIAETAHERCDFFRTLSQCAFPYHCNTPPGRNQGLHCLSVVALVA